MDRRVIYGMHWGRKGDASEMYCAVHNADCPMHGAGRDAEVLLINPGMIPSSWICPQAAEEIAEMADHGPGGGFGLGL